MLIVTSTPVENSEGSIFVVPLSKRNQSLIVFGRIQPWISAITDSGSDPEPPQFFHYAWSAHHMMRRMRYNPQHRNGLNFRSGRRSHLRTFILKGKLTIYYDKIRRGLGYVTPPISFCLKETNLSRYIPPVHLSGNQMSVWGWSSKTSLSVWLQSVNWSWMKLLKYLILSHGVAARSLWEKRFEQCELPTEDRVIQVDVGS